jgi:outer membrane protein assembly factor BamB
MRRLLIIAALLLLSLSRNSMAEAGSSADNYWPQWRGPRATGVAPHADPPVEWSEAKNVAWKTEIPGKGSASPIVWGDSVYVLTAVPTGESLKAEAESSPGDRGPRGIQPTQAQQFTILAIRRADGSVAWRKILREAVPHEGTHATGTWASNSPVTDGEHIYAYFGSHGLYCLDMEGNLVWEKDLGDMQTRRSFGEGSSPALAGNTILVNWDHEGDSFIVALDKRTGDEIWRKDRDEITSWSTPLIVEHEGRQQAIVNATGKVRSYDLSNGEIIWEASGMTVNVIPTPVYVDGLVLVTSGFRGNALLAIRLDGAKGDITGTDSIVWSLDKDTPYTPSPLLYGDQIYFTKTNDGILSSYNARSGEKYFGPVRLDEVPNIYASPVGASGRVYIAGRDGATLVIENGPDFKVLAVNELDDGFDASPALAGKELYLRGMKSLYRISE